MSEENTNYTSPNTPPIYPADKPKKTIPTFIGIAIIVVAAIVFFGGVFVWQHFSIKNNPTSEPALSEVEGWKTYSNSQYGFEVKYPQEWEVQNELWEPGDVVIPQITIRKKSDKLSESNSSIIVLPEGLPTSANDSVNTQERKDYFAGKNATFRDYLTVEGEIFEEHIFDISDLASNWGQHAYIMIKYKFSNFRWECAIQSSDEECGYGIGRKFFGNIDEDEYEIIQEMISTFKFTK